MNNYSLTTVGIRERIKLHAFAAVAVLFLSIYGKVVCPFIDQLALSRVMEGLLAVLLVQVILRELAYKLFPTPFWKITLARHGYYISVATWLIAGVVASVIHMFLYTDFPIVSHAKLLSGYWGLGAGILAQLEYVYLERYFRKLLLKAPEVPMEMFTHRLMEGFILFTLIPTMTMVLVSFRFVYEGFTDKDAAFEVLFLGACFVLAGMFTSWRYGRSLRDDCNNLTYAVNDVSKGNFSAKIDSTRPDELGHVANGLNKMIKGLALRERIKDAFGRFVNPKVAETFIETYARSGEKIELGGQRREVVILMADIRNFTPLAESMPPEELTDMLNDYFSEMVMAVQENGGMVDKFIGDAIMVLFGLTDDKTDPATAAVTAAIAMQEGLQRFNDRQTEQNKPALKNGIGIHAGEVVVGYLGSQDRLEFTAIGHAVNLTSRIESVAKEPNPSILFSETVASRITGKYKPVAVAELFLKGVSEKTPLFTVQA